MVPNLINVSHGTIQFVMYEELKHRLAAKNKKNIVIEISLVQKKILNVSLQFQSPQESLACCVLSKLMATLVTYPCQNLRARAQAGELAGKNATNFLGVLQNEGLRGLYRGLIPTLVHVTPNVCIVFLVYEFFVGKK